jgi:hypothetical protein
MTFAPDRYDHLPEPQDDQEAAEALLELGANANPDADVSYAIDAAESRAARGAKDADHALTEACAYALAANHAAYDGPVSAARAAADSCARAARLARFAWQTACEAAADAGAIAHADPEAAHAARESAKAATGSARLARLAAYEARLEVEKAERNTPRPDAGCDRCGTEDRVPGYKHCDACMREEAEFGSDQRPPAAPPERNAIAEILSLAQIDADDPALALDALSRIRRVAGAALADPDAPPPPAEPEQHACPACCQATLTGAAGPDGLCDDCEKAEAEKGCA